jgi:hypothetical protein
MVLNTIGALGVAFVLLYVVAVTIRLFGGGGFATLIGQTAVNGVVSYAMLSVSFVGLPVVGVMVLMPLALRIFAYAWFYRQGKKLLNGDFGEQARWALELFEEGDDEFIEASARLSQIQLREIGIVADDKEELRELTVEHAQEMDE